MMIRSLPGSLPGHIEGGPNGCDYHIFPWEHVYDASGARVHDRWDPTTRTVYRDVQLPCSVARIVIDLKVGE